jgi:hypothetical protein
MKFFLPVFICTLAILSYNYQAIISRLSSLVFKHQNTTLSAMSRVQTASPLNATFVGLPVIPASDPSLEAPDNMSIPRAIRQSFLAVSQSEGAGAKVRRSIGVPKLRNLSPFLMLDHFSIGENAGFPDHPHRGQETVTYLLSGSVNHEDFAGNKGTIG